MDGVGVGLNFEGSDNLVNCEEQKQFQASLYFAASFLQISFEMAVSLIGLRMFSVVRRWGWRTEAITLLPQCQTPFDGLVGLVSSPMSTPD